MSKKNTEAAPTDAVATTTSPFFNSVRALARYLACDEVTIRRLMRKKMLPYVRLGGRYLFRKSEVEEVLSRHHVAAVRPRRAE